jgi:hypothetical protein
VSSTEIEVPPVLEEFIKTVNDFKSPTKGLQAFAAQGRLGDLAKGVQELADAAADSGYVPPAKREEYQKWNNLAKSVSDRELARHYREKAKRAASQIGSQL